MASSSGNIVARSLVCVLVVSTLGAQAGVPYAAQGSQPVTEVPIRDLSAPISADEEPELDIWWALLQLWVAVNCMILSCDEEIDPLREAQMMLADDQADVKSMMQCQINSYIADGVRGDLTEAEKAEAALNLEQTREAIHERPNELPAELRDDYLAMLGLAIEDLNDE